MTLLLLALLPIIIWCCCTLIRFLKETWWRPWRFKKMMRSQGIRGPPYRFLYGNTREAAGLIARAMAAPMDISHHILPRVQPHIHSWSNTYGRNFLTWMGSKPRLYIGDPELIKEVLINKGGHFTKLPPPAHFRKLLGLGLVTAAGEKWARQRRLASRSFHIRSVKDMRPAIVMSVEIMLEKWQEQEGKEIDLAKEFMVLTSDIISRVAFGSNYLEGKIIFSKLDELAAIAARMEQRMRIPLLGKFIWDREDKESDRVEQCISKLFRQMIKKRMEDAQGFGRDFLASLVHAMHGDNEDERITMEDIIDECKTFYFTGYETTQNALTWTALLLAINSDWQEKVRKEVLQLSASSESNDITKLKTLGMIISESLRLYPPAPSIIRSLTKEERLGNIDLPAGIQVVVSTVAVHHDREIWGEDAHIFKPERFAETTSRASNNSMTFMPFGMGPRICVGLNLAMMELKVVLSMILQRYSLVLSPAYAHSPVLRLTTTPQHGLQVLLHKL